MAGEREEGEVQLEKLSAEQCEGESKCSENHRDYAIALYYCYVDLISTTTDNENTTTKNVVVESIVQQQLNLCRLLNLNGRIRVSPEGLNGVLSGLSADLSEYERQTTRALPNPTELDVKYCHLRKELSIQSQLFETLSVKETREVVSLYEQSSSSFSAAATVDASSKRYFRRRRRNREKHEYRQQVTRRMDPSTSSSVMIASPHDVRLSPYEPAKHLSPEQWNEMLLSSVSSRDYVLLDARNVYESRVGHFRAEGVKTILTNTRKYSSLPTVLKQSKGQLAGKHVLMYCTGGVRCERASVHLQALANDAREWEGLDPIRGIYQLHGGIQRYLEHYGAIDDETDTPGDCLYLGKNFVFDPRRTDPCVGKGCVGSCMLCQAPHDDYDNGQAPCENAEARCCHCRVLLLVCPTCRRRVSSWGEKQDEATTKPKLYCGIHECTQEGNSTQVAVLE